MEVRLHILAWAGKQPLAFSSLSYSVLLNDWLLVASHSLQGSGTTRVVLLLHSSCPESTAVSASDCCSVIAIPQLRLRLGRDPELPLPLQPDVLFDEIFIVFYQ